MYRNLGGPLRHGHRPIRRVWAGLRKGGVRGREKVRDQIPLRPMTSRLGPHRPTLACAAGGSTSR